MSVYSELTSRLPTAKERIEWEPYINSDGMIQFNPLCIDCEHTCKQSYRHEIVYCRKKSGKGKR